MAEDSEASRSETLVGLPRTSIQKFPLSGSVASRFAEELVRVRVLYAEAVFVSGNEQLCPRDGQRVGDDPPIEL